MPEITINHTDGNNVDFNGLCRELDEYLDCVAGGAVNREKYKPYNTTEDIGDAFVAYKDGMPVGCASFRRYGNDTAEVKRVFVKKDFRGEGIGKRLLKSVHEAASEKGFSRLILETGEPLSESIALYRSMGYTVTENFGPYTEMPESICMERIL